LVSWTEIPSRAQTRLISLEAEYVFENGEHSKKVKDMTDNPSYLKYYEFNVKRGRGGE